MEAKWLVWPRDKLYWPTSIIFRAAHCASLATTNPPTSISVAHADAVIRIRSERNLAFSARVLAKLSKRV